ncbi:kinase-like domain-containing protein [Lipomyces oligophaga]|uniref:kinase-like domain-containing protein n=1 Tax=Lipomyces oligophaga TaxID=45792 RepID=UPI0034CF5868
MNNMDQDLLPRLDEKAESELKAKTAAKHKERLSALCKTPPTLIRSKTSGLEFHRGQCLGEGGFARCFQVEDDDGHIYAAKTIAKSSLTSSKTRIKLLGEIKVHQSMDHPNIVKFIECFEDDTNVYILLEVCSNKTLMDMHRRRKRFTEPEARYFMIQILGAVKYMHSRKVIHRDLKLGNIFLDKDMHVKIGDFGLAALLLSESDRKKTICGTPNYIAPEVLFGKQDGHSLEVDLWSVGIILYAMLVGKPPFQSKDVNVIYKRIKANDYRFPEDVNISDDARDLIQSLLNKDPKARPSLDDIVDHPFFYGETPSYLPVTCLEGVPHWKHLTPSISRRNFLKLAAASGIGPGSGNGSLVSSQAGNPVEVNDVIQEIQTVDTSESVERILPECLSPKVSNTNLRQIVSHAAAEHQEEAKAVRLSSLRSLRSKPLSDLPINMPHSTNTEPVNYSPLARSRRLGYKEGTKQLATTELDLKAVTHYPMSTVMSRPMPCMDVPLEKFAPSSTNPTFMLKEIHDMLIKALADEYIPTYGQHDSGTYITQWVDYSNKYGMGYQLSNNCTGLYFNDSSSIVAHPESDTFEYITFPGLPTFKRQRYAYKQAPHMLEKKLYLVKHFREYMMEHLYVPISNEASATKETDVGQEMPFLTDFIRMPEAILFRLNTGEIQFNFMDHYKFIFFNYGRSIQVIDPSRQTSVHNIREFVRQSRRRAKLDRDGRSIATAGGDKMFQRLDICEVVISSWYSRSCAAFGKPKRTQQR